MAGMDKNEEVALLKGIEKNTYDSTGFLKDASTMLGKMSFSFGKLGGIFKGNLGINKLTSNITNIFNNVGKKLTGTFGKLKTGIGSAFSGIASKFKNPFAGLKGKLSGIGSAAKEKVGAVKDKIKNFFSPNVEKLQAKFYKKFLNIKNLAKEWFAAAKKAGAGSGGYSKTNQGDVFDTINKEIKLIGLAIRSIAVMINLFIAVFWPMLAITLFIVLVPIVALIILGLIIVMFILCNMLTKLLQPLFDAIGKAITTLVNAVAGPINIIATAIALIVDAVSGVIVEVLNQIRNFISVVGPIITNTIAGVLIIIQGALSVGLIILEKMLDAISHVLRGLLNWGPFKGGDKAVEELGLNKIKDVITKTKEKTAAAFEGGGPRIEQSAPMPNTFFTDLANWQASILNNIVSINTYTSQLLNTLSNGLFLAPITEFLSISLPEIISTSIDGAMRLFADWTTYLEDSLISYTEEINKNVSKLADFFAPTDKINVDEEKQVTFFEKLEAQARQQTYLLRSLNNAVLSLVSSNVQISNEPKKSWKNLWGVASVSDNKKVNNLQNVIQREDPAEKYKPIIDEINDIGEKLDRIIQNTSLTESGNLKTGAWSV